MDKRKPTYGSAVRMVGLVRLLSQEWRPVPLELIAEQLSISTRTAQRYRKALNEYFRVEPDKEEGECDAQPCDFIAVAREDGNEKWFLRDLEEFQSAAFFRMVSVLVAKALFQSLQGTVIKDGLEQIFLLFKEQAPSHHLTDFYERKIKYSGFGTKNYAIKNETLMAILKGLIFQRKLEVLYFSKEAGKEKYHCVRPYTLLFHHDSLYLIGKAEEYDRFEIRTFLLDRIKSAVLTKEKFKYPTDYHPDNIIHGSFGIFDQPEGKSFKVVAAFKEYIWDEVATRQWHISQKITPPEKGWFKLEVIITNTHEFKPWVLQFGSRAKVLEPEWLKKELKEELLAAVGNY